MARWVITGGSGFLGRHLLAELSHEEARGDEVFALGRRLPSGVSPSKFLRTDLAIDRGLASLLANLEPDFVIHAAGETPPANSNAFDRGNWRATANLVESLEAIARPVRLVSLGSAAELGRVPEDALPVGESHPCRPENAYAVSKLKATERVAGALSPVRGMVARVFNPIGPGLPASQVFGRICAELAVPREEPIRLAVGDLTTRRDFVDARDVARAVVLLAHRGRGGEIYHVGTGRSRSVGEGVEFLVKQSEKRVEWVAMNLAPGVADSRADPSKITRDTGWLPRISWEQSLSDQWAEVAREFRRS